MNKDEEVASILRRLREKLNNKFDVDLALKQAREMVAAEVFHDVTLLESICADDAARGDHVNYRKHLRELRDVSKPLDAAVQSILGQNDVTTEDITTLIEYAKELK